MEYEAVKYKYRKDGSRDTWAVFSRTARAYVLFGKKAEMIKRCNELNKIQSLQKHTK